MRDDLRGLRTILDRRAKAKLVIAMVGSVVVAICDGLAVALVVPLVSLASGVGADVPIVTEISAALGDPSERRLTIILTCAVVVLFLLKDLGSLAFAWFQAGFVSLERVRLSSRILDAMLTAPYTTVSARSAAELIRTADTAVMQVFNYTINGLIITASSAIAIVVMLVALIAIAPLPTIIILAYFLIASLVFERLIRRRAQDSGATMADSSMRGFRAALAAVGGLKEVKLRGTKDYFVGEFSSAQLAGARAGRVAGFLGALPKYLLEILFIIAIAITLVLGTTSSSNSGPLGLLALFVTAGFRLLPSVSALLTNVGNIRIGTEPLRLVRAELDKPAPTESPAAGPAITPTSAEPSLPGIVAQDIAFAYPRSDRLVLDGVRLHLPWGGTSAIVGGSGAGKTTLVDVLLGLHTPSSGRVLVDGADIRTDLRAWQRRISYVAQDVFLLEATIAQNVAFDQPDEAIDRERVRSALHQARLAEQVFDMPGGIDAMVGERGVDLSGGQRQRLGIARALYRRCDVLVLDEATSSLDNQTEHEIASTLRGLHGEVTIVLIAHRLSTVRDADQIIFLANGAVDGVGTFEELVELNSHFAELVRLGSLNLGERPTSRTTRGSR